MAREGLSCSICGGPHRSWILARPDEGQGDGSGLAFVALQEREREHRAAVAEGLARPVDADDRLRSTVNVDAVTDVLVEIVGGAPTEHDLVRRISGVRTARHDPDTEGCE